MLRMRYLDIVVCACPESDLACLFYLFIILFVLGRLYSIPIPRPRPPQTAAADFKRSHRNCREKNLGIAARRVGAVPIEI